MKAMYLDNPDEVFSMLTGVLASGSLCALKRLDISDSFASDCGVAELLRALVSRCPTFKVLSAGGDMIRSRSG